MPAKRFNYARTNTKTGKTVTAIDASMFEVRQRVAWTVTDSLGGTRKEATDAATAIKGTGTYEVGHYKVTVVENGMCPICGVGDLSEELCFDSRRPPAAVFPRCVYCCECHAEDVVPATPPVLVRT